MFKLNGNITEIIVFKKRDEKTVINIAFTKRGFRREHDFVYFGSLFTADGKVDGELFRRRYEGRRCQYEALMNGVSKNEEWQRCVRRLQRNILDTQGSQWRVLLSGYDWGKACGSYCRFIRQFVHLCVKRDAR